MKTAYSYIRFSRKHQAHGDSLRRQTTLAEQWCQANGYVLDEDLKITDMGVSGYTGANATEGSLSIFLSAVNHGKIRAGSVLLVESLDRLSRQEVSIAATQLFNLVNNGIDVVTLGDNYRYTKGMDIGQLFMALGKMITAHEESAKRAQRLQAVWAERKRTGKAMGLPPFWLKMNDSKSYDLLPDKAKVVQLMFSMYLNGEASRSIARKLTQEGHPTPRERSITWSDTMVRKTLKSPAVYGTRVLSDTGEEIPDVYPVIVSYEDWLKVQAGFATNKNVGISDKTSDVNNLFSGIIKCSCGASFQYRHHKRADGGFWKYLYCRAKRHGHPCEQSSFRYDIVEKYMLLSLNMLPYSTLFPERALASLRGEMTAQIAELEARLADNDKRQKRLMLAIENGEGDDVLELMERRKALKREASDMETTLSHMQGKLAEAITTEENAQNDIESMIEASGTPEKRKGLRQLLRLYIEGIQVTGERSMVIQMKNSPTSYTLAMSDDWMEAAAESSDGNRRFMAISRKELSH